MLTGLFYEVIKQLYLLIIKMAGVLLNQSIKAIMEKGSEESLTLFAYFVRTWERKSMFYFYLILLLLMSVPKILNENIVILVTRWKCSWTLIKTYILDPLTVL